MSKNTNTKETHDTTVKDAEKILGTSTSTQETQSTQTKGK